MTDERSPSSLRPTLSDVLEALVSSFSSARVQADIRSAKVSQMYLEHDMLRGVPVPRLRLNKVQVMLPVVVTAVYPGRDFALATPEVIAERVVDDLRRQIVRARRGVLSEARQVLDNAAVVRPGSPAARLLKRLNDTLSDGFSLILPTSEEGDEAGAQPAAADAASSELQSLLHNGFALSLAPFFDGRALTDAASELKLKEACHQVVERMLRHWVSQRRRQLDSNESDERAESFAYVMGEKEPRGNSEKGKPEGLLTPYAGEVYERLLDTIPELLRRLGARAGQSALATPSEPPRIEVATHTADVKNEGTPSTTTRINMVMTEEGLEWVAETDESGGRNWKLMTE